MNSRSMTKLAFSTLVLLIGLSGYAPAQDANNYYFATFETAVSKSGQDVSSDNPEEQRFYVSNIIAISREETALARRLKSVADDYFTAAIVNPLKAKGFEHQYYDDAISINDSVVYRLDTRADVEQLRAKVLSELKERNVNVFTYTWIFGDKAVSFEKAKPTLYYREPGKPFYMPGETKAAPPVRKNN